MRVAAVALLALTGCASHQAEQKAALDSWGDCVMQAVKQTDDGRTDPASMAYGIAPMCASLYNNFSEAMQKDMTTHNSRSYMRGATQENEIRLIVSAILTNRRAAHPR